jgi:hypothetical protein
MVIILNLFHHQCPLSKDSLASLEVILSLIITIGRYPKIIFLLWQLQLFIFSGSYSQSFLDSLASNPLPSRDHRQ